MFDRKSFKASLIRLGYADAKFHTRNVSFEDLARASRTFVTVDAQIRPEDWGALADAAHSALGILSTNY